MDMDLTKRQKEIFDFIRRYAAKTGYPPTVREIGKAVGLHSSSTVHAHLANLEKSDCCAAIPRSRARSSCCRPRQEGASGGRRAAAGRPGRGRRSRSSPRRTSRSTSRSPT